MIVDILNRMAVKNGDTDYEFNIYSMGLESTAYGKTVGPCVRSKYVIHYVIDGKGMFDDIPIGRGDGFLICPNQLHKYTSDTESPLKYGWISFFGYGNEDILRDVGLTLNNQVFKCDWIEKLESIFEMLCRDKLNDIDVAQYLKGCFYILMSFHKKAYEDSKKSLKAKSLIKEHVSTAVKYINDNYCKKISVEDVAAECFISAHYLSNIFKREMGFSPQHYILDVRIKRAKELILIEKLSITDIANSVGYSDVLAFSKIFKKAVGVSPRSYREIMLKVNKN